MRFNLTRDFYIPKGSIKVVDKQSDAVAYIYASESGKPSARVFFGKQTKPVASYYYSSEAQREAAVKAAFEGRRASLNAKQERKANRKPIKLNVGDILYTSWGYDQTNVEFYQVTKLIGSTMVEVREIGQSREATGWETGNCKPTKDHFIGEAHRCKLNESGIKVDRQYAWPHKDGESHRWSSYA